MIGWRDFTPDQASGNGWRCFLLLFWKNYHRQHLGRAQGCCQVPQDAEHSLPPLTLLVVMLVMPRIRNMGSDNHVILRKSLYLVTKFLLVAIILSLKDSTHQRPRGPLGWCKQTSNMGTKVFIHKEPWSTHQKSLLKTNRVKSVHNQRSQNDRRMWLHQYDVMVPEVRLELLDMCAISSGNAKRNDHSP